MSEGQQIELAIEKAVAGGWMLARHHGQIVLVRGAIPGERVRAWVERVEKQMAYAVTREVVEASSDRRPDAEDPLCGGALYSHIGYPRQLSLKADVVRDAFSRLARYPIGGEIAVAGSPETGYRMRARFHLQRGRAGFYREGTHQLCEAAATHQLQPAAVAAAGRLAAAIARGEADATGEISIAENIAGDERAAFVEVPGPGEALGLAVEQLLPGSGLVGLVLRTSTGRRFAAGTPFVSDPLDALAGAGGPHRLRRSAESFFQGNRYLVSTLVDAVDALIPASGAIVDLYAGVGLFSVSLAARGRHDIVAVEGDRASGDDLMENVRPFEPAVTARVGRVEAYLRERRREPPATVIVDPPRSGLSKEARAALLDLHASRIVYVSCDPPTLARDTRALLDAGYRMTDLRAFDLFPNTPHVECVAAFSAASGPR